MKKNICMLIHIMAVLVIMAGLIELHVYSRDGYGFTWTKSRSYEESILFSDQVSEDISSLKRLAILKNAFEAEADGELSDEKIIIYASTSNGSMHYSISDMIVQAGVYGYTMDEAGYAISYNAGAEQNARGEAYELKVTYKAYDPFFFENTTFGPTQGLTNIRDLSLDALKAVSEYYTLRDIYETDKTNFIYNLLFESDDEFSVEMENSSRSIDEIRAMPKYIVVNDDRSIDTNISPQPVGILSTDNSFEFNWAEGDVLSIGIDTGYIYNDRYKEAADEFDSSISYVKRWMIALAVCAFAAALSLVLAVRGFGESDNRELTMDRIPLEALVFLCAAASVILYILFKMTINMAFEEMYETADWEYLRDMGKAAVIWVCCLPIVQSVYRRTLNGGCFKYSLTAGFFRYLAGDEDGSAAWEAGKGYFVFIVLHVVAVAFIIWCYGRTDGGLNYIIAIILTGSFLAAFDIAVYVYRYNEARQKHELNDVIRKLSGGDTFGRVDEAHFTGDRLDTAKNLNNISQGLEAAVSERVKADRLQADLITNVSHDIRTPLTSIINYVDLLKRENVADEKIREYIDILDKKSARLKNLTEDLLEASRASSGNISMDISCIDMVQLVSQAGGELGDKFSARNLALEMDTPGHAVYVMADGRYLWRVFENLFNNAAKYSMEGTRVYADVSEKDGNARFTIKNISAQRLNISPDELTARFVRGDVSRNTEGSGLGLNIAESLTRLMGGSLVIQIDGDLYKAMVTLKVADKPDSAEFDDGRESGNAVRA